jgi:hypothetical protein
MRILAVGVPLLIAISFACTPTDVGECCQVSEGVDPSIVPMPKFASDGSPATVIARDAQFLCSELTCVSYQASTAYCTQACNFDSSCPEGFVCASVINSSANEATVGPEDRYCVKAGHACGQ